MISIAIPFRLPSLNEYINKCRSNRYGGANFKRSIENNIILILNTRHFLIASPVHITFVWHEPNKKRDKDNVAFAKKFILDAMQKAGRLKNDNNQFISGFTDKFVYDSTEGVEVLIDLEMSNDTQKCHFPDGISIKPDGVNELDPCIYQDVEKYRNVTVTVSRCIRCGHVDITWERQENTERIEIDD